MQRENTSTRFSSNSEASASELLENLEEVCFRDYNGRYQKIYHQHQQIGYVMRRKGFNLNCYSRR